MPKLLSVSQLASYIKGVFADEILLHDIDVYGEISEFKITKDKTFITIRENDFALSCIKFATHEPIPLGVKVILNGGVSFYDKTGKISFNIKNIKVSGEGEQYIKLLKLKQQLDKEGLLASQKPLPQYIKNIALITSETGAVLHDIISVNSQRHNVNIFILNASVQGSEAATDIVKALDTINQFQTKFDCVIIARGGGSNLDLDVFNSEAVARSVAACKLPVISAIGHQTDYTLCDLCASVRAGTPSIAAEIVSAINDEFLKQIYFNTKKIDFLVKQIFDKTKNKLYKLWNNVSSAANLRLAVNRNELKNKIFKLNKCVLNLQNSHFNKVKSAANYLNTAIKAKLNYFEQKLDKTQTLLDKNSPLKILSQGYAKIFKDSLPVLSSKNVNSNDNVKIIMSDGSFNANVLDK